MTTLDNDFLAKTSKNFECSMCDYVTSRKYNLISHLNSIKHKNNTITTENNDFLVKTSKTYNCQNCDRKFNDRAGLWRHKKKCVTENENKEDTVFKNDTTDNKDNLINFLIKENQEFKNLILEIVKKDTYNNSNNTTTNSHNKSFNLNFFLNETCKDAMNIMDFVDSIKLQLSDLEKVGELGYVNGISNIIVKNLKELDVTQRPVHCTDKKRETLYVKDENKWEKDDEKKKLRKAIKRVASKNQRLLLKFKEVHPDCGTSSSKYSDQYNTIIVESMGGSGDNDIEKEEKIIKNITKQIVIEKEN
jgi:hypothetical protein